MSTPDTTGEALAAILEELRAIRAALGSQSSVEVKTSTRGVDICCKAYVGSPIIEAEADAVASYFRVFNEIQDRLMGVTRDKAA